VVCVRLTRIAQPAQQVLDREDVARQVDMLAVASDLDAQPP
jgi:hypothetical protein